MRGRDLHFNRAGVGGGHHLRAADLNLHHARAIAIIHEAADRIRHAGRVGHDDEAILRIPLLGVGADSVVKERRSAIR